MERKESWAGDLAMLGGNEWIPELKILFPRWSHWRQWNAKFSFINTVEVVINGISRTFEYFYEEFLL